MNDYVDGSQVDVVVKIPPGPDSNFFNQPGHIQVTIDITRPTYFAGVLGIVNRRVTTTAVARNASDLSVAHSMIALNPGDCQTAKFGGNGTVTVEGSIQVDFELLVGAVRSRGQRHGSCAGLLRRRRLPRQHQVGRGL